MSTPLLASLAAAAGLLAAEDPLLRVGERVTETLRDGDATLPGRGLAKRFRLAPREKGRITVSLESFDFDAILRVEPEGGAPAEDNDGGIETNARLVLDASPSSPILVWAAAVDERGSGEFVLSVDAGATALPEGAALLEASITYRATAAERALARGDALWAGWHRLQEGNLRFRASRHGEARSAYESSLELSRRAGDASTALAALGGLGIALRALGEHAEAGARFGEYLSLVRESGDRRAQAWAHASLGNVAWSMRDAEAAKANFANHLALSRELGDRAEEARAHANLGFVCESEGDPAGAKRHYERSLEICRETGDSPGEARACAGLGNACLALGETSRARALYEHHLVLAKEMKVPAEELLALGNLARLHVGLGEYARAVEEYERGVALAQGLGDRASEMRTRGDLGAALGFLGEYAKAREQFEAALARAAEIGDRAEEARALGNLGTIHRSLGEPAKARENYRRYLSLSRDLRDRSGEATALGALASLEIELAEYAAAREHADAYLALVREAGDRPGEAAALGTLASLRLALGSYAEARALLERQLDLAREIGDRGRESSALGSLAGLHLSLGDYERAFATAERQLAIARDTGAAADEVRALGTMGIARYYLGDFARARALYEERRARCRALGDRAGEARTLGHLGSLAFSLGEFAEARDHHERHAALARELGDRAGEALALSNLANDLVSLGELGRAREAAAASLSKMEEIGLEEDQLFPLGALVRAAIAERSAGEARALLDRATRLLDRPSVGALDRTEAATLRSRWTEWGERAQDVAALRLAQDGASPVDRERFLREGFAAAGRWKGRALLEGIAERRTGGRSPETIRLRREVRETLLRRDGLLDRVADRIREGRAAEEIRGLRREAEDLLAQADAAWGRLREIAPREAALERGTEIGPDEIRASVLREGDVLVEFAEGGTRLYGYVLASRGFAFLDLGARAEIDAAVEGFLAGVADPARGLASAEVIARSGKRLFDLLLAPALAEAGEGVERLLLVPTASLASLPFEALVSGWAGEAAPRTFAAIEFVLDRFEVCYGPSSPVLAEIAALGPRREAGRVLVLADPLYPSESVAPAEGRPPGEPSLLAASRALPNPSEFQRLEKTRTEALALSRGLLLDADDREAAADLALLAGRRSGSLAARRFDLHLGAAASPGRLEGDLRGYAVLHLAAHGYVDREHPERTGIALAFEGERDGFVTIAEALDLYLDANLVVLSACDTARGRSLAGEGVQSMARAFLHAGARGVVASLWQVADWAGAETMEKVYAGAIGEDLPPSRALREAKLALRRGGPSRGVAGVVGAPVETGHPFFWAPFVHIGLPR